MAAADSGRLDTTTVPVALSTQRNAGMSTIEPWRMPHWLTPVCDDQPVSQPTRRCVPSRSQRSSVGTSPERRARSSTTSASAVELHEHEPGHVGGRRAAWPAAGRGGPSCWSNQASSSSASTDETSVVIAARPMTTTSAVQKPVELDAGQPVEHERDEQGVEHDGADAQREHRESARRRTASAGQTTALTQADDEAGEQGVRGRSMSKPSSSQARTHSASAASDGHDERRGRRPGSTAVARAAGRTIASAAGRAAHACAPLTRRHRSRIASLDAGAGRARGPAGRRAPAGGPRRRPARAPSRKRCTGSSSQAGRPRRTPTGLNVPQWIGTTRSGADQLGRLRRPRSGSRWPSPSVGPQPQIGSRATSTGAHVAHLVEQVGVAGEVDGDARRRAARSRRRRRRRGCAARAASVDGRHGLDRQRADGRSCAPARVSRTSRKPLRRSRPPAPAGTMIGTSAAEQPQRRQVEVVHVDVGDQDDVGHADRRRRRRGGGAAGGPRGRSAPGR